jgi:hypothetical protein
LPVLTTSSVTVNTGNNNTHFWFTLLLGCPFVNATTVTEVGLIIDSIDIDPGSETNAKQLLLLYFPLSNPVNVPAQGAIKFMFTIAFKISP